MSDWGGGDSQHVVTRPDSTRLDSLGVKAAASQLVGPPVILESGDTNDVILKNINRRKVSVHC